jgi:site-specific recombinase XerD
VWERIRKVAGLEDVRIHDLRHSYASTAVGAGFSLTITGKLLGHTQAATTQRYAHLADDPLRKANEMIGRRIETLMGKQKPDRTPRLAGAK